MTGKKRIDTLLVERGFATSLDEARRLIGAGQVRINEKLHDKAGTEVAEASRIVVKTIRRFVSRGGEKLFAALQGLSIDPSDLICADIGASTGGFTDCLLQYGAAKIYAIDVGYGLLAWKLRNDARVVVRERVNARYLSVKDIAEPLDLAVMDASFISANLLIPPLLPFFSQQIRLLVLVKPQFQLPRGKVMEGGVVQNPLLQEEAVANVRDFAKNLDLVCEHVFPCPVHGAKGNKEFFLYLTGINPSGAGGIKEKVNT